MKEHYYLDNASTTWPKPEPVYQFMDAFFRSHGVNPGRAGHSLAVEAEQMIFETRRLLAQFFSFRGDPNRVVFTQNVTDSLNIALFGLIREGDHVITTRVEHNSVLRPLHHLERDHGVQVTRVGSDAEGYVDPGAAADADHATACGHALAHIESVEVSHIRHIHNALDATDGVTVYGPRGNRPRVATLSFNIESLPAPQVGEMLDADYHVCVRAGLHCAPLVHEDCGTSEILGAVRIAPGYFTDDEDLEHALEAIAELAR